MKRRIFSFIILFISLFLFSCSILEGAEVNSDDFPEAVESRTTNGVITNFTQLFVGDDVRTILPEAWTYSDIGTAEGKLHFYVYGYATNGLKTSNGSGGELIPIGIESIDPYTGVFSLDLKPYNWTLFIVVNTQASSTTYSDALKTAVMTAKAHVDLTSYASSTEFYLTSVGLDGSGKVKGDINLDRWDMPQNCTAKIGIYDIISDEVIKTASQFPVEIITPALNTSQISSVIKYKFGGEDGYTIKCGRYNFKVTFTTVNGKQFVYSDLIEIVPQKLTDCTISVPDIIDKPPLAPENLRVCYDGSSISAQNYAPDTYSVFIAWDDKANNEKEFKLQLQEFESNSLPGDGIAWISLSSGDYRGYDKEVVNNEKIYAAGSLICNSNFVVLRLPLGSKYGMRICASNDGGESEWCNWINADPNTPGKELVLSGTYASTFPTSPIDETNISYFYGYDVIGGNPKTGKQRDGISNATLSDSIALTRMRYYTQGGKWLKEWNKGTEVYSIEGKVKQIKECLSDYENDSKSFSSNYIEYYSPCSVCIGERASLAAGAPLWRFYNSRLQKNIIPLGYWRENTPYGTRRCPDTGFNSTETPYRYTGSKNMDWYADYVQQSYFEFEDKSFLESECSWYKLEDSSGNVFVACNDAENLLAPEFEKLYFQSVSFNAGKPDLKIYVTVPDSKIELTKALGGTWDETAGKATSGKYDSITVEVERAKQVLFSKTKLNNQLSEIGLPTEFVWPSFDKGRYTIKFTFKKDTEIRTKTFALIITD